MPRVEATVLIQASPETVTSVLLDADLAPQWTAGLQRLEVVSGTVGVAGSVGHAHYRSGGRDTVLEDVLEAAIANRFYRSRITGGGLSAVVETELTPIGDDATQLRLRWDGHGTTAITRIALPFMRRRIAHRAKTDLEALRRLCEAGP